jgi:hypothetical protein
LPAPLFRGADNSLGDGTGEFYMDAETEHSESLDSLQFAPPPTASSLQSRLMQKLGRPLRISVSKRGPVAKLKSVCTVSVCYAFYRVTFDILSGCCKLESSVKRQ